MLLEDLKKTITSELSAIPAGIVPTSGVTLDEVLRLSMAEEPPLTNKKLPGFHDAVILLASLKFARDRAIRELLFVASDLGFESEAVRRLGDELGLRASLVVGTDELLANLKFGTALVENLTAFMSSHIAILNDYLASHLPSRSNFMSQTSADISPTSLLVASVHSAIPEITPIPGQECNVRLHLIIKGEMWEQPSEYRIMLGWSGVGPRPVVPPPGWVKTTLYATGRARVMFEGEMTFTGQPVVESLTFTEY